MLENGFFTNPTSDQLWRFEASYANVNSMNGQKSYALTLQRFDELEIFWNAKYATDWRDNKGGNSNKIFVDKWLVAHGKPGTVK